MEKRIQQLIDYKKLNSSQFAEEIGVQRSSISHILSGRNKPSLDLVLKILERFTDINQNWLLFGKGQMLKEFDLFTTVNNIGSEKKEKKTVSDTTSKDTSIKDNQESPDFIDIVSKNLFKNTQNLSNQTLEYQNIPANHTSKEEELPKNEKEIEKIIVLYKNGKFKDYVPD